VKMFEVLWQVFRYLILLMVYMHLIMF